MMTRCASIWYLIAICKHQWWALCTPLLLRHWVQWDHILVKVLGPPTADIMPHFGWSVLAVANVSTSSCVVGLLAVPTPLMGVAFCTHVLKSTLCHLKITPSTLWGSGILVGQHVRFPRGLQHHKLENDEGDLSEAFPGD
jgi:hypothetical protein